MRHTVVYEGRVQGVGFRATVREIARRHEVAGWVRNEPDGSVRMEAEGDPEELTRFRNAIRDTMKSFISREREQTSDDAGTFEGFEVRR